MNTTIGGEIGSDVGSLNLAYGTKLVRASSVQMQIIYIYIYT